MKTIATKSCKIVMQEQITKFYEKIPFPSRSSHKAYEDIVPQNLDGLKVGDFGCGQSLFIDKFRKLKLNAIFLDISHNALTTIDYGKKIRASLTNIPLRDDYMDVIFCIGVVHHIPEMEKAISELIRVVKRGGKLDLGVYADKSVQATLRKIYDFSNNFFLQKIIYMLAGLLVWIKNRKNGLHFASIDHYNRIDDLLKTPLVRYLPANYYKEIIKNYKCKVIGLKRISSMNIIIVEK